MDVAPSLPSSTTHKAVKGGVFSLKPHPLSDPLEEQQERLPTEPFLWPVAGFLLTQLRPPAHRIMSLKIQGRSSHLDEPNPEKSLADMFRG